MRRERIGIDELDCSILVDMCGRCGRYNPVQDLTEEQKEWIIERNKKVEEWNIKHAIHCSICQSKEG